MSMCRATLNMLCNGVATLVVARWEKEIDAETLRANLLALTSDSEPVSAAQAT
jgi:aerobic C4-dicarboxylate transport protein